ncbi:MAG: decaprenyl-phosphate phosphoribosyltransferase [Ignavibacteria bacterium]|nr:MAG: decaprenyl-phosphate phosphoribosyltransferase [Chlorobiota bacterium]MBV6399517.1 Decaprenyl-phosphate phosphoribosyltransferase [Ignavibacteria bacterium]MCC6886639.1 decaprenyl-phosphate phosphoribosyltransferase [Ignavibacteriales bacterium]MCE7953222.1 decaprenyl-phosphate phosphoribosyltransferase [Chlorobi bacterium CHB7]RIK50089.1 MAG: decaprenyl-phosphate phosphoribosyltransferase [Ignavibacteriota bacterium]
MKILKLIELMRPKQWIKNLFCFAAILFAGKLTDLNLLLINIIAFFAFCGISSCVYIVNDISDIESDRIHKIKRFRPLASGDVSINEAKILLLLLFVATVILSLQLNWGFQIVILFYFIINLFYSLKVKNVVLLDVFFISIGFMLRVISGAFAIDVSISNWMIITTIFISLFLAISKRRAELSQADLEDVGKQRKVLASYSIPFTDQLNTVAATGTIISYALYTVSDKATETFGTDHLIYTTPFVIYGIFRYMYLTHQKNLGESPSSIVTKDLPIIINSILWFLISFLIIYRFKIGIPYI